MTATYQQMLGELRLTANERRDHIELLEITGKRDPAEIGNKKARLRIYEDAVNFFEVVSKSVRQEP